MQVVKIWDENTLESEIQQAKVNLFVTHGSEYDREGS